MKSEYVDIGIKVKNAICLFFFFIQTCLQIKYSSANCKRIKFIELR